MLTPVIDLLGEDRLSWLGGLLVGGLFGFFAQRSRFCLRAAVIEFSRGEGGARLAVWLLTFASALAAAAARELRLEGFSDGLGMRRYLLGAVLMGFGAMLAGGCAVGAGVTGASVFALTAWLVLGGMWLGAGLTDLLVDRRGTAQRQAAANSPAGC